MRVDVFALRTGIRQRRLSAAVSLGCGRPAPATGPASGELCISERPAPVVGAGGVWAMLARVVGAGYAEPRACAQATACEIEHIVAPGGGGPTGARTLDSLTVPLRTLSSLPARELTALRVTGTLATWDHAGTPRHARL